MEPSRSHGKIPEGATLNRWHGTAPIQARTQTLSLVTRKTRTERTTSSKTAMYRRSWPRRTPSLQSQMRRVVSGTTRSFSSSQRYGGRSRWSDKNRDTRYLFQRLSISIQGHTYWRALFRFVYYTGMLLHEHQHQVGLAEATRCTFEGTGFELKIADRGGLLINRLMRR